MIKKYESAGCTVVQHAGRQAPCLIYSKITQMNEGTHTYIHTELIVRFWSTEGFIFSPWAKRHYICTVKFLSRCCLNKFSQILWVLELYRHRGIWKQGMTSSNLTLEDSSFALSCLSDSETHSVPCIVFCFCFFDRQNVSLATSPYLFLWKVQGSCCPLTVWGCPVLKNDTCM